MQNFTQVTTLLVVLSSGIWYSYQTYLGRVKPVLSTWLIILTGASLSLITYLLASDWNIRSGILNIADVANLAIIVTSILLWSKAKTKLCSFEKWYFLGMGFIVMFWLLSSNAFISNLLLQGLIWIGYFPTIHKLAVEKTNTESYLSWGGALLAGLIALPIAIGNILALIYVVRTIVMISIVLFLMYFYENKERKLNKQNPKLV